MERAMGDKASGWRLLVNADRCQGHNRCYLLLPDLIELDDHGFASVKDDGAVPEAMLEKARLAVRNCPEFALRLERASREETAR
jgi:ferredoxin